MSVASFQDSSVSQLTLTDLLRRFRFGPDSSNPLSSAWQYGDDATLRDQYEFWPARVRAWRTPQGSEKERGFYVFFHSAKIFEWMFLGLSMACFVILHVQLLEWPSTTSYHSMALLIWLLIAALYLAGIWVRLGSHFAEKWLSGYFMEFIFSIENVFIFSFTVEAFDLPRRQCQKAMFIVICFQILFQMVFFMGLADKLRSIIVLPYLLGMWLICLGIETARQRHHTASHPEEYFLFKFCKYCWGRRLDKNFRDDQSIFWWDDSSWGITMLGPAVLSLLLVDFVMEIDVTLTKIEDIRNHYIAFSSSVVAAFAVPELFFVARDAFQKFPMLKLGMTIVLIFFGIELMLHQLVHIPDIVSVGIILVILASCMLMSKCVGSAPDAEKPSSEGDKPQVPCN